MKHHHQHSIFPLTLVTAYLLLLFHRSSGSNSGASPAMGNNAAHTANKCGFITLIREVLDIPRYQTEIIHEPGHMRTHARLLQLLIDNFSMEDKA